MNAIPFIVVVSTIPVGCKNVIGGNRISSSVGNAESYEISALSINGIELEVDLLV